MPADWLIAYRILMMRVWVGPGPWVAQLTGALVQAWPCLCQGQLTTGASSGASWDPGKVAPAASSMLQDTASAAALWAWRAGGRAQAGWERPEVLHGEAQGFDFFPLLMDEL